jgi:hypothetical protein
MATTNSGRDVLAAAAKCKELMTDRARGVHREDYGEYEPARLVVISDRSVAEKIPEILRTYRTIDEFWAFIKPEYGSYAERQEFIRRSFEPLLDTLEARHVADPEDGAPLPFGCTEDELFSKIVQLLMARGHEREVAVLTAGRLSLQYRESDGWGDVEQWVINIALYLPLYEQLNATQREHCEKTITRIAQELPRSTDDWVAATSIFVDIKPNAEWRNVALKWLRGEGLNNQGRVRSDNMPTREVDGLLFRSNPEVLLYRALKSKGVVFAPLAVFLRGGESYDRVEPDFVVLREGAAMLVESMATHSMSSRPPRPISEPGCSRSRACISNG